MTKEMKASAVANANIALTKYWGKREKSLILPFQSSTSMTCDGLQTVTTVEFSPAFAQDMISVNDEELKKDEKDVLGHLDRIRKMAGITHKAKVVSETNFPVAAGLASSASGLAAITLAAATAAGLKLNERDLTILARQGSGSACRSIPSGFSVWHRGSKPDGSDSFAEQIAKPEHWPEFRMIATILTEARKKVGSRAGMAHSVDTCPFYPAWADTAEKDSQQMIELVRKKDFTGVGRLAEHNCLKMHSVMLSTQPSIMYWIPQSLDVMRHVVAWREEGLESYFTIDGGPQVKIICLAKDVPEIQKRLTDVPGVLRTVECRPGQGARPVGKHLF